MGPKQIVLHIGYPKTGTTSSQDEMPVEVKVMKIGGVREWIG